MTNARGAFCTHRKYVQEPVKNVTQETTKKEQSKTDIKKTNMNRKGEQ